MADYDGITDVDDLSENGNGVALNVYPPRYPALAFRVADGDYGAITVSGAGMVWSLNALVLGLGISDIDGLQDALDLKRDTSTIVSLDKGGTGVALTPPGADRILFWDESTSALTWLSLGTNISISGTTLNASGGAGSTDWGLIGGAIEDQIDLQAALNNKADIAGTDFTGDITATNLAGSNTGDQFTTVTATALLGRGAGTNGAAQEITLGTGLSMTGTTLNASTTGVTNNSITNAMLRQSVALSVIGRSANSTGNVADITASTDGHVLRRSGSTLGFGTIPSTSVTGLGTAATSPASDFADAITTVHSYSSNQTVSDGTHNGSYNRMTGATTRTITFGSSPSAGHASRWVNRGTVNMTVVCSGGYYKNGASSTATANLTLAPGGRLAAFHEGSGVWAFDGSGF